MAKLQVNINDVMKKTKLTVHVKGVKVFKLKMFIATNLIKLAAFILNCGIVIEKEI